MPTLADLVPEGMEAGAGLSLQDETGRHLFFLASTRHCCPPGEQFYAGIGGHRQPDKDLAACIRREAREEVDVAIELLPASATWYLPNAALRLYPLGMARALGRTLRELGHAALGIASSPKAGSSQ
jgi:ADP-ribose pyrophosphatase YjhB (NUDIX family)